MYYLCNENKGTAQLICTFVLAYAKSRFSHDVAQLVSIAVQADLCLITCLITLVLLQNLHDFDHYAPNFEKVGDILVSACPYVCVFMFEISS